ncbi:glycosyltransferase involved in cell wall biosynthesis [Sporosarcina luteola]|nr:glycosyltransferase involved in cell wall biosynthesis [Sporosarcina luteola]
MGKKVLHILPSNDLAGAENVAISMISHMSDPFECAYASPEGGIKEILMDRGIRHIPLHQFTSSQIRKVVKEWKPDIIHAHDFKATIKSLFSFTSIPVISHIHQNPIWLHRLNLRSVLFFAACLKLDQVIVVSPVIKERTLLAYAFKSKTMAISNVVDREWIKQKAAFPADDCYDMAFIGRFEDVKDPLRFIQIVSEVKQQMPDLKVIMMGGGTLADECRKVIQAKGMQQTIELKGFMDNPYPLLNTSKVLVLTSKSEGLPMVVMEAMTLGKPVVVPRLTGMDTIVEESCGCICETDAEFIQNLITLLQSEETYARMSQAALKKAELVCNMEFYIEQVKKVYHDAISN